MKAIGITNHVIDLKLPPKYSQKTDFITFHVTLSFQFKKLW